MATVHRKIQRFSFPVSHLENTVLNVGTTVLNWAWQPPYFWAELEPTTVVQGPYVTVTQRFSRVKVQTVLNQLPGGFQEEEFSFWQFTPNTVIAERPRENL
jgi:hypothetical protein